MKGMWNNKIFKLFLNILFLLWWNDYSDLRVAYCIIIKKRLSEEWELFFEFNIIEHRKCIILNMI